MPHTATVESEERTFLPKLFLAVGAVVLTPIALWLFCMGIGGCKALLGFLCHCLQ